jgi:hypothetical protein|uniref:Uncharacterized protein n=1 Tax=Ackermannviridae sp. ctClB2 TaxID=2825752 RepID=A0A8S5P0I5_9CAUD|nr:MAG TPA: hypothetical protein [Ackermannviridae sp. ctClB2]
METQFKNRQDLVDYFENLPRMLYIVMGDKRVTLHSYKFARLILFSMGAEMHRDGKLDLLAYTKLTRMYSQDFIDHQRGTNRQEYQYDDKEMDFIEEMVSLFSLEILKAEFISDVQFRILLCNENVIDIILQ